MAWNRLEIAVIAVILGCAGVLSGMASVTPEKMPARLIERAWEKRLAGNEDSRPWPWLESVPVARLMIPALDKDFIVMRGASGDVLAFAPGWHEGTSPPGEPGISLIAAHSDLHFGFLRDVQPGLEVVLQDVNGRKRYYAIQETRIVQEPEIRVPADADRGTLLLSTSFPFNNWQEGAVMQFVVVAVEQPNLNAAVTGEGSADGRG